MEIPQVDQYVLQGERFSEAVRGVGSVPVSLETAIGNMVVIDALFRSAEQAGWSVLGRIQNEGEARIQRKEPM
jgi:hypothetical protein